MRRAGLSGTFSTHPATTTAAMLGVALAGAALASWLVRRKRRAQPTAEAIEVAPARERARAPES